MTTLDRWRISGCVWLGALVVCGAWGEEPQGTVSLPPSRFYSVQLHEEVEVQSSLIRLGDLVQLIAAPDESWPRVSRTVIGLVPQDGRRLRIDRQRIQEVLQQHGSLSRELRWLGPDAVHVRYVPPSPLAGLSTSPSVRAAALNMNSAASTVAAPERDVRAVDEAASSLLPAERHRIERLILMAFQQTHAEVLKEYEVSFDPQEKSLDTLAQMNKVRSLRLRDTPRSGSVALEITAEMDGGPRALEIRLQMEPLPKALMTTTALGRGDLVAAGDVSIQSIPKKQWDPRMLADPTALVGMQVKRAIAAGRPIYAEDLTQPIVIERGDLVELRVLGAGIRVTAHGRALGSAAAGESIEIEVDKPKRKVIARAASYGVAEILSRPPGTP